MKFTLSWLKEYLDTNASIEEISEKLTSIGLEVESVIDYAKILKPFSVAEILETEQHPQADRLKICKVNAGNGEILSIVCGAANARAGIKIPLARVGAIIPNGGFEIKKSKIRGVESNGMLCSAEELNLEEASEGILELPENSIVGESFAKFINKEDALFEIAITPNRGDCLGVYGVARDLSATGIGKLKPLNFTEISGDFESTIKVNIAENAGKYFVGVYIKNVDNSKPCQWLKEKLESIGKKSISPAVDITNYLTFAFGRPAHIYDADKLSGNLSVRFAKEGEKIKALDGNEYNLSEEIPVIADDKSPVAIAGIIGGLDSGVDEKTKNIFLEIANFDSETIAKAGRKLQIDSDARYRFERNIDFNSYKLFNYAVKLITDICGGNPSKPELSGDLTFENKKINFDFLLTKKITGVEISEEESKNILKSLGFEIKNNSEIQVPSWRNDVSIAEDLAEEIARINGFDKIPTKFLEKPVAKIEPLNAKQKKISNIRKTMVSQGLDEVVSFSFTNSNFAKSFENQSNLIEVANPISQDLNVMRPSIIVTLLEALQKNIVRQRNNLRLFEIGNIFKKNQGDFEQILCISGVLTGERRGKTPNFQAENYDFFDAKYFAELIISEFIDTSKLKIQKTNSEFFHPGKSGEFVLGNKKIAILGELHPEILKIFDIKQNILAFEIFIDNLPEAKEKLGFAKKLMVENNLPFVERDFAFVLDKNIQSAEIISAVKKAQKDFLEDVQIFDVFESDKLGENKKSVALKTILQPKEKTFTDQEINTISDNIINAVKTNCKAEIR
ncbi:MAG: phenylalanine--tRNA ligase subunit beta [Rickettsiales bacterium]|nr:phenylalanine--tRNA ligase subunit beta [Rickettsiales bacterium]